LKKLSRLTASSCNLKNICDDILDCQELFILDVHNNLKLDTIPVELSRLPNIVAICIDDTNISTQTKKIMEKNSNGDVCIIKYGD
jgi:Leucine-rich repeat (LRR) protein